MIIAFLIAIIGMIPLVLAICVIKIYKGSELSFALLLYMLSTTLWQIDVSTLYLKGIFSEEIITWLFKIFRIGPTFMVPIVFYLAYVLIRKHAANIKDRKIYQFLLLVFTRKFLIFLVTWSVIIYVINMTNLGIVGLKEVRILHSSTISYFPEYGRFNFLYLLHTSSFIIFVIFSFLISRLIQNIYLKDFLSTFSFCSFLLYVSGFMNFIPGTGSLVSSLGIIIFSVIIVFSFVRMHTMLTVNFNRLMERQKKLDNAGNLTASLMHEVKNTLQIIRGYSQLLSEVSSLPAGGKQMNLMILTATIQLDELLHNYTQLLKYKAIEFKMVDLNDIIEQAIEISKELIQRNMVEVFFEKKYRTLKTYGNETYLRQVFVNLIKNSLEAFPEERKERNITIQTDIQVDRICIDFLDNGKGIPTDQWETIFDPFHTSKKDGLGLGLPFVKNIILEHRGDIKIVDSSHMGTQLQIMLPQYAFSDF